MLWCVPALPLSGFLILLLAHRHLSRLMQSLIGVGFIALSFVASLLVVFQHWGEPEYNEILWTWIPPAHLGFHLDPLSTLMILVVSFVAGLVALYSLRFMGHDPSFGRFFAYLNLFVAAMLVLVLADNLLLLFAGWEGVGLCSYLLIGFWYQRPETNIAANKAFITTRIGDVFLLLGLVYLSLELGTLHISTALKLMTEQWPVGSGIATLIALCILAGSVGKSAQVPLHTWLPDAMLGPTPASALIHAATMVTAGVYLMARTAPLFSLAPVAQNAVLIVGAATLLLGSMCALRQNDLKRVLAYSTISQIGYMFLALGAGSPGAAMFHFMTHAFFKALLFLGAGVIGEALHHEYNMLKMGGLRHQLPLTYFTFLMGSLSLAGLPLVTAGFYSKELILGETYSSDSAGLWPWIIGCAGAFFTALYVGRMVILVFFGTSKTQVSQLPTWHMTVPVIVLAALSIVAGVLETPLLAYLGFGHHPVDYLAFTIASAVPIVGLGFAWLIYASKAPSKKTRTKPGSFGFDQIYQALLLSPYQKLGAALRSDYFNSCYRWLVRLISMIHGLLSRTQSGRIEHYLTIVVASAITVIGYLVLS